MDKIVLVAAQSGNWRFWEGRAKARMWFNWYVLFPVLLGLFGYLPSKRFSGMENLPKHVANQWRSWGKHREYLMSDPTLGETYFGEITTPITAFSIDDDDFAPKIAADWMTAQYSRADKKSVHLRPSDFETHAIGHFGIFKDKFKGSIWTKLLGALQS